MSHSLERKSSKYRSDIDGLRAIAIISVVGFHAFPNVLSGGFIGVDMFFVISGFLITKIITGNLDANQFNFLDFYGRRVRRIFPALIFMLLAAILLGWFSLLSDEYKQLGKHVIGSAGFASNFVLWDESGYFDNSAETKPLLHLWSLGVEEQFYIVWPLLLWLAYRRRLNIAIPLIAVILLSFTLNILSYNSYPIATFYSPLTRMWELLIGSSYAYASQQTHNNLATLLSKPSIHPSIIRICRNHNIRSTIGLIFILIGIYSIKKEFWFPGPWALLPTLGTLLIIASYQAWLNRMILSNHILVWFGLISFPLYLWHWPILSFARILEGQTPSYKSRIILIIVSIVLSWLTYALIEKPLRFGNKRNFKSIVLVIAMVFSGFSGYVVYNNNGMQSRSVVEFNNKINSGDDTWDNGHTGDGCGLNIGKIQNISFGYCKHDLRETPRFALIGDSKAAALWGGLVRTSNINDRWLFIGGASANGAPVPILSANHIYKQYQSQLTIALESVVNNNQIEKVALVASTRGIFQLKNGMTSIEELPYNDNYEIALDGLNNAVDRLVKAKKKVILVVDNPTLNDPRDCLQRTTSLTLINKMIPGENRPGCYIALSKHMELSAKYRKLLQSVANTHPAKVTIFDPLNILCNKDADRCPLSKNGRLLYGYTDHISDYAAGLVGRELNDLMAKGM